MAMESTQSWPASFRAEGESQDCKREQESQRRDADQAKRRRPAAADK